MHHINVIKADGSIEPFNPTKLLTSLLSAGASEEDAHKILESVLQEVEGQTLHTAKIYSKAFRHLHEMEHPAAVRYSLKRALAELGPDGFSFEKFFCEILKKQNYEAVVDQTVYGKCVPHEVDIVAWRGDDELVMVEAKFHNEYGFKTDLKIALYVKARFEDLAEGKFVYGDKERKLTKGWLVTNTKFTESAIRYAVCNDMKLIGWNYPADGNLQKLVEESGLRPITSVPSLSTSEIKEFLREGVVTCNDTAVIETILRRLGTTEEKIDQVKRDALRVCAVTSTDTSEKE